jgi:2-haloacid dehalogenase
MAIEVIAFDVNETLLDLSSLDDEFEEVLGSAALRPQWFAQMLQLSFVGGLTGRYVDFRTAQLAAFEMLAQRQGATVAPGVAEAVVDRMTSLTPYPEVSAALKRLAPTRLQVVALTNSTEVVARAQLENARLGDHFDAVLSADTVRALKPSPTAYRHVASTMRVDLDEIRLVAAHPWDVSGALAAGCRAAFVRRPGFVPSPLGPQADIVGADIAEVVDQIIARDVDSTR